MAVASVLSFQPHAGVASTCRAAAASGSVVFSLASFVPQRARAPGKREDALLPRGHLKTRRSHNGARGAPRYPALFSIAYTGAARHSWLRAWWRGKRRERRMPLSSFEVVGPVEGRRDFFSGGPHSLPTQLTFGALGVPMLLIAMLPRPRPRSRPPGASARASRRALRIPGPD